jgi:hypothetical protein
MAASRVDLKPAVLRAASSRFALSVFHLYASFIFELLRRPVAVELNSIFRFKESIIDRKPLFYQPRGGPSLRALASKITRSTPRDLFRHGRFSANLSPACQSLRISEPASFTRLFCDGAVVGREASWSAGDQKPARSPLGT